MAEKHGIINLKQCGCTDLLSNLAASSPKRDISSLTKERRWVPNALTNFLYFFCWCSRVVCLHVNLCPKVELQNTQSSVVYVIYLNIDTWLIIIFFCGKQTSTKATNFFQFCWREMYNILTETHKEFMSFWFWSIPLKWYIIYGHGINIF